MLATRLSKLHTGGIFVVVIDTLSFRLHSIVAIGFVLWLKPEVRMGRT